MSHNTQCRPESEVGTIVVASVPKDERSLAVVDPFAVLAGLIIIFINNKQANRKRDKYNIAQAAITI